MSGTEYNPAPFIANAKKTLKDNNNVAAHFASCRDIMLSSVQEITDLTAKNNPVVPELAYSTIQNNKVSTTDIKQIRKRGCLICLLYTSPSPRDGLLSRMPSSA